MASESSDNFNTAAFLNEFSQIMILVAAFLFYIFFFFLRKKPAEKTENPTESPEELLNKYLDKVKKPDNK